LAGLGVALALVWLLGGRLFALAGTETGTAPELQVCTVGCSFSTIQDAVDAAPDGAAIKVAQGDYTDLHLRKGVTQVVYISHTVTIRGGYTTTNWITPDTDAHPTTLDAQEGGRVLVITGDITPTIEGLRITGGDPTGLGGSWTGDVGGGVYAYYAQPVLVDNVIYGNRAQHGGGVFLYQSPATLNRNAVYSNTAVSSGGGLRIDTSDATLRGNEIYSNTAWAGAGVELAWSDSSFSGDIIRNNVGNTGSGFDLWAANPTLTNCVVADNIIMWALGKGSAMYLTDDSHPRLLHATVARNRGGNGSGIYVSAYDTGQDIVPSYITMTNTIFVSHTVGITAAAHTTATLHATLWHDNGANWGGNVIHTGDQDGDPAFKSDGYHLGGASAAIGRGVNAGVTRDIDGEDRPMGPAPDLGADEFPAFGIHLPIVTRNH
jgi:hypothetical protein